MRAISWVKALPLRVQLTCIGFGYAAVLAYAIMAEFTRYLAELRDPVASSGGMWAFGDEILAWFLFCLFLAPTFFLILLMRQYEGAFLKYSRILFWFSLTAPLCLAVILLAQTVRMSGMVDPLLWRTWRAPFVLMVLAMSRLLARIEPAKRLLTRALLVEGGTLAIFAALLVFPGR